MSLMSFYFDACYYPLFLPGKLGGISYAEYSQETETAEWSASKKVSTLKNDALREVEKLKSSQNSSNMCIYTYITCHVLHILYVFTVYIYTYYSIVLLEYVLICFI